MTKILCLDQFGELGGAQRSLLDLLPGFVEKGWRPEVMLPGPGSFSNALIDAGYATRFYACATYTSSHKPAREVLRYAFELPRVMQQIRQITTATGSSLLYVNGPRLLPPAALVARSKRLPLVFHSHNRLAQPSALALARHSLRICDAHMVGCCGYVAEPLRESQTATKLAVIYNGVAAAKAVRAWRFPLRRIGVIGRIEPEKGQLLFLRAARLLAGDFPRCTFHIVGAPLFSDNSYYWQVRQEAADLPVEFCGWQADPAETLAALDMLVVPSAAIEATTRVILEAYAAGVPVVALPSGGIPEVVLDQQTGFLAENHTAEALAARVAFALRLPASKLKWIVANARGAWRSRFTIGRYRDQVCGVISTLLREPEAYAYTAARIAR